MGPLHAGQSGRGGLAARQPRAQGRGEGHLTRRRRCHSVRSPRADVREVDGIPTISFTPEAGPLKNRRSVRTFPLHPVVLAAGFLPFVKDQRTGVLFPDLLLDRHGKRSLNGSKIIGRWVRKLGITDPRLKSSHSWRHRFRTMSRKHRLAVDVVDTILGHTRATVGDSYGEYPPSAMLRELMKLPDILATAKSSANAKFEVERLDYAASHT